MACRRVCDTTAAVSGRSEQSERVISMNSAYLGRKDIGPEIHRQKQNNTIVWVVRNKVKQKKKKKKRTEMWVTSTAACGEYRSEKVNSWDEEERVAEEKM